MSVGGQLYAAKGRSTVCLSLSLEVNNWRLGIGKRGLTTRWKEKGRTERVEGVDSRVELGRSSRDIEHNNNIQHTTRGSQHCLSAVCWMRALLWPNTLVGRKQEDPWWAGDSTHASIVYVEKGAWWFVSVLAVGGREREGVTMGERDELHSGRVLDGTFGRELSHVEAGDLES